MPATLFNKGILLAGGSGSRLYPLTIAVNKHLLPVYDKPMIHYSLATLLATGIREVLFITRPEDVEQFQRLWGDGRSLGIEIRYATQPRPAGIAQAFLIGEEFIGEEHVALLLGDNIFWGDDLENVIRPALGRTSGASILACRVPDPERYGVVEFDAAEQPVALIEKPASGGSHWAVPGLYFFDNDVIELARRLKPSPRGELEILDLHQSYLERGKLHVERLTGDIAWLDVGTHESLVQAADLVRQHEKKLQKKVGCPEEVAFRRGYINAREFEQIARKIGNEYGDYLLGVLYGVENPA